MPIYSNEGGVIYEHTAVSVNNGGVLGKRIVIAMDIVCRYNQWIMSRNHLLAEQLPHWPKYMR